MAKSILEQLTALLPENERATFQAKIDAHPDLKTQASKQAEIFTIYQGDDDTTTVETKPPTTVETKPPATVETKPPVAAAAASSADNSAILASLTDLKSSLDTRFADMEKKFVPVADLDKHRATMLSSAIKASDDYAQVRESHRAEFGKSLDRAAFEKFVEEQTGAGVKFKDMKSAHDSFVANDRIDLKVKTGIEEGLKQKRSGTEAPGQTQAVGLSPAQAVLKKAREASKTSDGKSNAISAAEKLSQMERAREEAGAGAVN